MMLITQYAPQVRQATRSVVLPFDVRQKARFIALLDNDVEAGFQLDRRKVLRDGDKLLANNGEVIVVVAKNEEVSTVSLDQSKLARVCYHLGNRHVTLQISGSWCRYRRDHVLDELVQILGGAVTHELVPFEPESGAYNSAYHHHDH